MKSQQSGFAHAFLIIGLLVALIGALGFIFWQNFIHKEAASTKNEVVVTQPVQQKETNELKIKELNKTLDLSDAPYDDITYTMTSINVDDPDKLVAAIYSKDLNSRLIKDQENNGPQPTNEYQRLNCNKAVYAFYGVDDIHTGVPGTALDPSNLPDEATLYVGYIGPCSPFDEELAQESIAFRDWLVDNLK